MIGCDYHFISTEPMEDERKEMGWEVKTAQPYEIKSFVSKENLKKAIMIADKSDVVITGSAPDTFIEGRLKNNKLVFRYSERIFKTGRWHILSPRVLAYLYSRHYKYRNNNTYLLCASAYTAGDFAVAGLYKTKAYKWGYFPEAKTYDINQLLKLKSSKTIEILWVGRFLGWKHPEAAIEVARRLKKDNISFRLRMVGAGEKEYDIRQLIAKYNLAEFVSLEGIMPPEKVRKHMERANIFLFTSDFNEGWGAVLNEAMNSGCAVVASHAIGSAPFLIKNGINGYLYRNGDIENLYVKVKRLAENRVLREDLGCNAYQTIAGEWNAENAAKKLIALFTAKLEGKEYFAEYGPCSRALELGNNLINK